MSVLWWGWEEEGRCNDVGCRGAMADACAVAVKVKLGYE